MALAPASSRGGGPAAGAYLPSAVAATLDTTTYTNPVTGVGKIPTLVTTANAPVLGVAMSGDAFLRLLLVSDLTDGLYISDGTFDAYNLGVSCLRVDASKNLHLAAPGGGASNRVNLGPSNIAAPTAATDVPPLNALSPLFTIASGALPTVALVSGTGAQILTTRDAETITPVTFNPGAATTATCTVALSPDNVTYSTLGIETEPAGVAFDGTIHLVKVRVPAGWYLKLTVNAQAVLGTTTYY